MAFPVHVASDILQQKVNVELPFTKLPSISQLRGVIGEVMTAQYYELAKQRQITLPSNQRFLIDRIQHYEDENGSWIDLTSVSQLHPYDQLYAFPADLSHVCNEQRELPQPGLVLLPDEWASSRRGTPRRHSSSPRAHSEEKSLSMHISNLSQISTYRIHSGTSEEAKARRIFELTDGIHRGSVTPCELGEVLRRYNISVPDQAVDEMFSAQQSCTRREWTCVADVEIWGRAYPVVFNCLYHRAAVAQREEELTVALKRYTQEVPHLEQRVGQLRQELDEAQKRLQEAQAMQENMGEELNSIKVRKPLDDGREQACVNKELDVAHKRLVLQREESLYKEMAHDVLGTAVEV